MTDPSSDDPPSAIPGVENLVEAVEQASPQIIEAVDAAGPHDLEPPHVLGPVGQFDQMVDQWFDHLRGNPVADRIFYAATELGDFGLIWMLIGATRGLKSDKDAAAAGRLAATLMAESFLVNGVIKSFFKRERPVSQEVRPYKMRIPLTTSFPSGHSSTAVVAALMLSEGSSAWPFYWALAGLVASSRVYVRIHHASDVAAGLATGLVIGSAAKFAWRRLAR